MAPKTTLRTAAVQLNATEDVERNLETADRLTRHAAGQGAQLVVLPEKWTVLGRSEVMEEHAQTLDGPAAQWAQQTAERTADRPDRRLLRRAPRRPAKTANTSLHIGPDGTIQAAYRKLHMFDVEVDGTVYAESAREQAGERSSTTHDPRQPPTHAARTLGMSICYDVRFPELLPRASVSAAPSCSTVPAAFTLATTRDHWEILLRARAIENQCFVIAANQIGAHPPGQPLRRPVDDHRPLGCGARDRPGQRVRDRRRARLQPARGRARAAAGAHASPRPAALRAPGRRTVTA